MNRLSFLPRRLAVMVLVAAAFALSGCKEVLYSDLTEMEANEMVAVLAAGGIDAARDRDKTGSYALKVEGDSVADAVVVLRRAGYPKQRFDSLGDVFAESGLVGTPFEERARFMYAMNEELSHTISEIKGIHSARVQVMIPTPEKFATDAPQATASVAILVEPGVEIATLVPSIKSLVSHSVPDLDYESVAVAIFPIDAPTLEVVPATGPAKPGGVTTMGFIDPGMTERMQHALLALVVLALVGGAVFFSTRTRRAP